MKLVRQQTILHIGIKGEQAKAKELLENHDLVDNVQPGDGRLIATLKQIETDYSDLATVLINNGLGITKFQEEEIDLESAFMALTKGTGANF